MINSISFKIVNKITHNNLEFQAFLKQRQIKKLKKKNEKPELPAVDIDQLSDFVDGMYILIVHNSFESNSQFGNIYGLWYCTIFFLLLIQ